MRQVPLLGPTLACSQSHSRTIWGVRRCAFPSGEVTACAAVGDILADVLLPLFLRQVTVGNVTGASLPRRNLNIGIPQAHHFVTAGRGQALTVGTEGHAVHPTRV